MDSIQKSHFQIEKHFLSNRPTPSCKCSDRIAKWYIVWTDAAGLVGIFMRSELTDRGIRTRVTNGKLLAYSRCGRLQRVVGDWLKAVRQANEI